MVWLPCGGLCVCVHDACGGVHAYQLTGQYQGRFFPRALPNAVVLEHTAGFVHAFCCGYADNPNGYTAPEIVSMWSSLVNEESAELCVRHGTVLVCPCAVLRMIALTLLRCVA